MREQTGDLFAVDGVDAVCITTNGIVTKRGACVLGRGVAARAKERWPGVDRILGAAIHQHGNVVQVLTGQYDKPPVPMLWDEEVIGGSPDSDGIVLPWHLVAFPVKHDWRDPALVTLIIKSANQLVALANQKAWKAVALPRPGCGNGGLDWARHVRPVLAPLLDDRFAIVDRAP